MTNASYMQLDKGPQELFLEDLTVLAPLSVENWRVCHGDSNACWPFNTKCASRNGTVENFPPFPALAQASSSGIASIV